MKIKGICAIILACLLIFISGCTPGNGPTAKPKIWTNSSDITDNISPDGGIGYYPQVAMDDNGNAIIVWQGFDGSYYQVFKSEYRNGSWTNPTDITDTVSIGGQHAYAPQVAMDNNGNAIIVWYEFDGSNYQIFKSEYRNGSWTNPSNLLDNISPNGQDAYTPHVAMDNIGNAIIVWRQWGGDTWQIYKSEYRSGSWTHPSSLADDNISIDGYSALDPLVAMDNNGNAIIVWYQSDGVNNQIFKSEYRSDTWTHPSGLTDNISPNGYDATDPHVAMDDNGNAIIVWSQYDGTNTQILKSEYRSGSWTNPSGSSESINPNGTVTDGQPAGSPQVAMDNNGNAIIVWWQSDGTYFNVYKSEYRSGSWVNPSGFSDYISPNGHTDYYHIPRPQVAMDNNGNAIIVWNQTDGSTWQIFKSEYRNSSWTNPSGLSDNISPDGYHAEYPQVAMDDDNNAIIVWVENDQIFKSEYR